MRGTVNGYRNSETHLVAEETEVPKVNPGLVYFGQQLSIVDESNLTRIEPGGKLWDRLRMSVLVIS